MKVEAGVFWAASGVIITLLIAILNVLFSQVRWQATINAKIDEHGRTIEEVKMRVTTLESHRR